MLPCLALISLLPHGSFVPMKWDEATLRTKLTGFWIEHDATVPREKRISTHGVIEWQMFQQLEEGDPPNRAYQIDNDNESQAFVGVLLMNTETRPMWLDFQFSDAGRQVVQLGIIEFDDDQLRWVRYGRVPLKAYNEVKGKHPDRPTAFVDEKKQPLGYTMVKWKKK